MPSEIVFISLNISSFDWWAEWKILFSVSLNEPKWQASLYCEKIQVIKISLIMVFIIRTQCTAPAHDTIYSISDQQIDIYHVILSSLRQFIKYLKSSCLTLEILYSFLHQRLQKDSDNNIVMIEVWWYYFRFSIFGMDPWWLSCPSVSPVLESS